jgi:hypothetical protein
MTQYKVKVPATREQGSYTTIAHATTATTAAADALSDYNSARAHDGLSPLKRMPPGTKYTRVK